LDTDCAIVLANHLLKEPIKHLLGLFQYDEIGLRDWAKERVAKAIWSNLEWQEELPRRLATATPRLRQIWKLECESFFPTEAQQKFSESGFKSIGICCDNCGEPSSLIDVPIGHECPVRFECLNCGKVRQLKVKLDENGSITSSETSSNAH